MISWGNVESVIAARFTPLDCMMCTSEKEASLSALLSFVLIFLEQKSSSKIFIISRWHFPTKITTWKLLRNPSILCWARTLDDNVFSIFVDILLLFLVNSTEAMTFGPICILIPEWTQWMDHVQMQSLNYLLTLQNSENDATYKVNN